MPLCEHHGCAAHGTEKLEMIRNGRHLFVDRAPTQLSAVPARYECKIVTRKDGPEFGCTSREFPAHLDPNEARHARLRQAGLKRRVTAEFGHIVVRPGD